MQCLFPILTSIATVFLCQKCHEQVSVFSDVGTAILFWITVYFQVGYFVTATVFLILGLEDAESRPTAMIVDGVFITVHEPVVLHGFGNVTILDNVHHICWKCHIQWDDSFLVWHGQNAWRNCLLPSSTSRSNSSARW